MKLSACSFLLIGSVAAASADVVTGQTANALPLTSIDVRFDQGEHRIEFTLRNDGLRTVVAWSVEITQAFADGTTNTTYLSADAWEDAAGIVPPESRSFHRVIGSGATLFDFMLVSRSTFPVDVSVRPLAALLDDDSVVGDPNHVGVILHGRAREEQALGELLFTLEGARRATDPQQAMRDAIQALASERRPDLLKSAARRSLVASLSGAEQGREDPAQALDTLIENTRLRKKAIQRFAKATLVNGQLVRQEASQ